MRVGARFATSRWLFPPRCCRPDRSSGRQPADRGLRQAAACPPGAPQEVALNVPRRPRRAPAWCLFAVASCFLTKASIRRLARWLHRPRHRRAGSAAAARLPPSRRRTSVPRSTVIYSARPALLRQSSSHPGEFAALRPKREGPPGAARPVRGPPAAAEPPVHGRRWGSAWCSNCCRGLALAGVAPASPAAAGLSRLGIAGTSSVAALRRLLEASAGVPPAGDSGDRP